MFSFILLSTIYLKVLSYSIITVDPPRSYISKYIESPPDIDGKINDEIWDQATWSKLFVDIEGNSKPLPSYNSRIKILYDSTYLYIAAQLQEPHIWAYQDEKNKHIYKYENDFEVFIDPNGDNCNYYELELNAINTIWELSLTAPYRNQGKVKDPDNMEGMKSATYISGTLNDGNDKDEFWSVEIALPFAGFTKYNASSLPPKSGDYWRINFSRVQWDHLLKDNDYIKKPNSAENNWVWSPQYEINMHAPEHWGYLFFDQINEDNYHLQEWEIEESLIDIYVQLKSGKDASEIKTNLEYPPEIKYINNEGNYIISYLHPDLKYVYKMNNKTCFWKTLK